MSLAEASTKRRLLSVFAVVGVLAARWSGLGLLHRYGFRYRSSQCRLPGSSHQRRWCRLWKDRGGHLDRSNRSGVWHLRLLRHPDAVSVGEPGERVRVFAYLAPPATPTSCSDTSVPNGMYTYTVTAIYNSFSAIEPSAPVTVAVPPLASAPGISRQSITAPTPLGEPRERHAHGHAQHQRGLGDCQGHLLLLLDVGRPMQQRQLDFNRNVVYGSELVGELVKLHPASRRHLRRGGYRDQQRRQSADQPGVVTHRGRHRHHGTGNDGQHSLDRECLEEHEPRQ